MSYKLTSAPTQLILLCGFKIVVNTQLSNGRWLRFLIISMRSNRSNYRGYSPSILSESFEIPCDRVYSNHLYEVHEPVEIMASVNQILQEISVKHVGEVEALLQMNLIIVEELMKNRLVRTMKTEKMLALAVCELVILIKGNSLVVKKPSSDNKHYTARHEYGHKISSISRGNSTSKTKGKGDVQAVMDQIDVMVRSMVSDSSYVDRHQPLNIERNLEHIENKLNAMFKRQNTRNSSKQLNNDHHKILANQRAIRDLLEQQLEDLEKQMYKAQTNAQNQLGVSNQLLQDTRRETVRLEKEVLRLKQKQTELSEYLGRRSNQDVDAFINSDLLPMLLAQGISLESLL